MYLIYCICLNFAYTILHPVPPLKRVDEVQYLKGSCARQLVALEVCWTHQGMRTRGCPLVSECRNDCSRRCSLSMHSLHLTQQNIELIQAIQLSS